MEHVLCSYVHVCMYVRTFEQVCVLYILLYDVYSTCNYIMHNVDPLFLFIIYYIYFPTLKMILSSLGNCWVMIFLPSLLLSLPRLKKLTSSQIVFAAYHPDDY